MISVVTHTTSFNTHRQQVICDGCDQCVDLDVDELVSRYGGDMELPEIGRRARCGSALASCGATHSLNNGIVLIWETID